MLVVDHMARYSASQPPQPDIEPFDVVLARVLQELLADDFDGVDDAQIAAATALLARAADAVGDDLFLVAPPANRGERRRNGRRSRRPPH